MPLETAKERKSFILCFVFERPMAYCLEFSERGKPLLFRGIYIYAGKGQKEHSPTIIFLRGGEVAADVVIGDRERLHGATAARLEFEHGLLQDPLQDRTQATSTRLGTDSLRSHQI